MNADRHDSWTSSGDVVDRLARLRALLPLLATDLASSRRRTNELEVQNRRLARRVEELESKLTSTSEEAS